MGFTGRSSSGGNPNGGNSSYGVDQAGSRNDDGLKRDPFSDGKNDGPSSHHSVGGGVMRSESVAGGGYGGVRVLDLPLQAGDNGAQRSKGGGGGGGWKGEGIGRKEIVTSRDAIMVEGADDDIMTIIN
jgi:hypothetical protein